MSPKTLIGTLGTVAVLAAGAAAPAVAATPPVPLAPTTVENLNAALHQEAFDWTTYTVFAEQARRERKSSATSAFTNASSVERNQHVVELGYHAGLVGTDEENLQAAIDGETYEATVMYPEFAATARREGCLEAANRFDRIAAEEWMHARKYQAALNAIRTGKGSIPRAGSLNYTTVTPQLPRCGGQTQANLYTAMKGESLATAKYQLFAARATANGRSAVAALFDGTATVEFREHMSNQANLAGLMRDTATNLSTAADRENTQATVTYPGYAAQAQAVGDPQVAQTFTDIATDEARLATTFLAAR